MKIYVTNNGTVTRHLPNTPDDGSTSGCLDAFPRNDILDQIHCDHIYSTSRRVNHESTEDFSGDDEDEFSDISDEEENRCEISRKPCVITHRLTVPECIKSQQLTEKHLTNVYQPQPDDNDGGEIVKVSSDTEYITLSSTNEEDSNKAAPDDVDRLSHSSNSYRSENTPVFLAPLDNDMISLNAESIQKVFQNMICMTSLTPIADTSNSQRHITNRAVTDNTLAEEKETSNSNIVWPVVNNAQIKSPGSSEGSQGKPFTIYSHDLDRKGQMFVKVRMGSNCINSGTSATKETSQPDQQPLEKQTSSDAKSTEKSNECNNKGDKPNVTKRQVKRRCSPGLRKPTDEGTETKETSSHSDPPRRDDDDTSIRKGSRSEPKQTCYQTVNGKEFKEISRELENDREMSAKMKYALELMVQKWGEYLTLTADQIREMEVENARDIGMVQDVIDMLEDKDRYVSQVIEDLKFF